MKTIKFRHIIAIILAIVSAGVNGIAKGKINSRKVIRRHVRECKMQENKFAIELSGG